MMLFVLSKSCRRSTILPGNHRGLSNDFAGGFFYEHINDQIMMLLTLIIYAAATVSIPMLPNITYLYAIGFVGGASIGISHIGNPPRSTAVNDMDSVDLPSLRSIRTSEAVQFPVARI